MKLDKEKEAMIIKMLDDLFYKDIRKESFARCGDFYDKNKRIPTDKEIHTIIDASFQKVMSHWKQHPENFKLVKNK